MQHTNQFALHAACQFIHLAIDEIKTVKSKELDSVIRELECVNGELGKYEAMVSN